uniref:Uncharacterized protein n=1 Tax=Aegilops tauschii subsp. strangulata TaxID=200361 RepID=A0A452ZHQ0_AEGTS
RHHKRVTFVEKKKHKRVTSYLLPLQETERELIISLQTASTDLSDHGDEACRPLLSSTPRDHLTRKPYTHFGGRFVASKSHLFHCVTYGHFLFCWFISI